VNAIIANVTRPPSGAGELAADITRVLGLVSTAVAAVALSFPDFAMFALILFGLSLARALRLRPALDVAFCATLLVAGWSSTLDLYTTVPGWDLLVHFVANGVIAAVAFLLYTAASASARGMAARGMSRGDVVLLTTSFGLALAAIWEMAEWAGHTYIDSTIYVEYADTIGDMVAGGLGAVLAGLLMRFLSSPTATTTARASASGDAGRAARDIPHPQSRSTTGERP
jgi:hypothetical protein